MRARWIFAVALAVLCALWQGCGTGADGTNGNSHIPSFDQSSPQGTDWDIDVVADDTNQTSIDSGWTADADLDTALTDLTLPDLADLLTGDLGPAQPDGGEAGLSPETESPTTQGSGGLTCAETVETTSGYAYCKTKIGSVEIKMVEPKQTDQPLYLAIYLHGDKASGYVGDWGWKPYATWGRERGVLTVAALAPNGCSWWRSATDVDCNQSGSDMAGVGAKALHEVIVELGKKYDLHRKPVLYVGMSGGSVFLTALMYRDYGAQHPGALVANCGGSKPWGNFSWTSSDETLRNLSTLYFVYGDADKLIAQIEDGIAYFQGKSFQVSTNKVAGVDHCGTFDWVKSTTEIWASHIAP